MLILMYLIYSVSHNDKRIRSSDGQSALSAGLVLAQIRGQRIRHTHVFGCKTPDREKKLTVIEKKILTYNITMSYHATMFLVNVFKCFYTDSNTLFNAVRDIFYLFHSCAVWL